MGVQLQLRPLQGRRRFVDWFEVFPFCFESDAEICRRWEQTLASSGDC
jgi:hypothetical protein